jgi:hypothetical protein
MKVLKSLNKLLPSRTLEKSSVDESSEIILKQQERIDYLQSWLNSVLVRPEHKRISDIESIISRLEKVSSNMLPYYVLDNYGHKYFKSECDTEFKVQLAQVILDHVRIYYPNYTNELLESIANNTSDYAANYIYMEKF